MINYKLLCCAAVVIGLAVAINAHTGGHKVESAMPYKSVTYKNIFINLKYFYNTFIQKYLQRAPATCCSRMRSRATPPRPGTRPRTRWPTHSPSSGAAAASRTPSAPTPWPTAAPLRVSRCRTSVMANIAHFRLHTQSRTLSRAHVTIDTW